MGLVGPEGVRTIEHPTVSPNRRSPGISERQTPHGEAVLTALRSAAANLDRHVDEVDALNVFPVPDGDTGFNMAATIRAALGEAEAIPLGERSLERVAGAVRSGALMGARGNSGVILSQILRGMAEVGERGARLDGPTLASALRRGSETAYAALAEPAEGTILTVIRDAAEAASAAAERDADREAVWTAAVEAAAASVARTPSLLAVLREAGVVDAGGHGLFRLLEGAIFAMRGEGAVAAAQPSAGSRGPVRARPHEEATLGYETMFLLSAGGCDLDLDAIREELTRLGRSVVVAGDERAVKVHVHNERPDRVIAYGLSLGSLTHISIEDLDSQSLDVAEARARSFTGGADPGGGGGRQGRLAPTLAPTLGVVAVAAGEGLARAMESAGATVIVRADIGDPASAELLAAIRSTGAREVLVLPNDRNVRLAADQAAEMATGTTVIVLPTRSQPEGVSALLALEPGRDAAANALVMRTAVGALRSLAVSTCVRAVPFRDRRVEEGETIVLDADGALAAADPDRETAVLAGVAALEPRFELLTLYRGRDADPAEAAGLADRLTAALGGVEVEVVDGDQPHYRYLIAAE